MDQEEATVSPSQKEKRFPVSYSSTGIVRQTIFSMAYVSGVNSTKCVYYRPIENGPVENG